MKYYAHYGHRTSSCASGHGGTSSSSTSCVRRVRDQRLRAVGRRPRRRRSMCATSRTGGSPSSTPGSTPTSGSACGGGSPSRARERVPGQLRRWPVGSPSDSYLDRFRESGKVADPPVRAPDLTRSTSSTRRGRHVEDLEHVALGLWVNAGFFAFRREIFDYMEHGRRARRGPFPRLIAERELLAYPVRRVLGVMDTFKDKCGWTRSRPGAPALACLALDGGRPPRPVLL